MTLRSGSGGKAVEKERVAEEKPPVAGTGVADEMVVAEEDHQQINTFRHALRLQTLLEEHHPRQSSLTEDLSEQAGNAINSKTVLR